MAVNFIIHNFKIAQIPKVPQWSVDNAKLEHRITKLVVNKPNFSLNVSLVQSKFFS